MCVKQNWSDSQVLSVIADKTGPKQTSSFVEDIRSNSWFISCAVKCESKKLPFYWKCSASHWWGKGFTYNKYLHKYVWAKSAFSMLLFTSHSPEFCTNICTYLHCGLSFITLDSGGRCKTSQLVVVVTVCDRPIANVIYNYIKIHNCVFVPLQLLRPRSHTSAACSASALWPSTLRLWEKRSAWAAGVDWQRGWTARSRTAWCSAVARWSSRRRFVWGWRKIRSTGTELCALASPTCRLRPDLCPCPSWPSQTSLTPKGTGPFLCLIPIAK